MGSHTPVPRRRRWRWAILAAVVVAAVLPAGANAASWQTVTLQDDVAFGETWDGDPASNMDDAVAHGVGGVRVMVNWYEVAPNRDSCSVPNVDRSDPANYDFHRLNNAVNNAWNRGLPVTIAFDGPFPCWASLSPSLSNCPGGSNKCVWKPHPDRYREFVEAVYRYVGPKVSRWEPWNEPSHTGHLDAGSTQYSAMAYRKLYFIAYDQIRCCSRPGTPFFFGTVNYKPSNVTTISDFLKYAFCRDGNWSSSDPTWYGSCGVTPRQVDAEVLAFHQYLGTNESPHQAAVIIDQASADLTAARNAGRTNAQWIAQDEAGVHVNEGNDGDSLGVSEAQQAAWVNCLDEAAWKQSNLARHAQYELQDPPFSPHYYTGLRRPAALGSKGPWRASWQAFAYPMTVWRRPDNALEAWGGWRPNPRPATLELVGLDSANTIRYQQTVSLGSGGYFNVAIPNAPSGLRWETVGPNFITSRLATGGDCGTDWNNGV